MTKPLFLRHLLRGLPAILVLAAGCGSGGSSSAGAGNPLSGPQVQAWVTSADKTLLLARVADPVFTELQPMALTIDVDASQRFQTMAGFGAAITDASAWLIQNRMSEPQRDALLKELFGRGPDGIGFDFARLTIAASDYSLSHYSFDDLPAGQTDMALAGFSIDPQRAATLPVVKRALAVNPQLQLMASPWSAPAWMKSSGSMIKGSLKPEMYGVYAAYLGRYLDAMAAEGVPIFALTLQNEPDFEPGDYPGMRVDAAARAALIGQHLGPLLASRNMKTRLFDWDHNWDQPQSPLAVLGDPIARPFVAGVAWHCYAGDVSAQNQVHDAYPDKETWFTECAGGDWAPSWAVSLPWLMHKLVIGSTRAWAKGVLMWNLALDENHGPQLGGCKNCRGVVTIDSKSGAVTRNLEYYGLAHASKFVRQGAQRIASSAVQDGVESVAFRNADDGSIALIVCNNEAQPRRFAVRFAGRQFTQQLPPQSVATYTWAAP